MRTSVEVEIVNSTAKKTAKDIIGLSDKLSKLFLKVKEREKDINDFKMLFGIIGFGGSKGVGVLAEAGSRLLDSLKKVEELEPLAQDLERLARSIKSSEQAFGVKESLKQVADLAKRDLEAAEERLREARKGLPIGHPGLIKIGLNPLTDEVEKLSFFIPLLEGLRDSDVTGVFCTR